MIKGAKELRASAMAAIASFVRIRKGYGLDDLHKGLKSMRLDPVASALHGSLILLGVKPPTKFTSTRYHQLRVSSDGKTLAVRLYDSFPLAATQKDEEVLWLYTKLFEGDFLGEERSYGDKQLKFLHPDISNPLKSEASDALSCLIGHLSAGTDLFQFMRLEEGVSDDGFTLKVDTKGAKRLIVGIETYFYSGTGGKTSWGLGGVGDWDPAAWERKLAPVTQLFTKWFQQGVSVETSRKNYMTYWLKKIKEDASHLPMIVALGDDGDFWQRCKEPLAKLVLNHGDAGINALLSLL